MGFLLFPWLQSGWLIESFPQLLLHDCLVMLVKDADELHK